MLKKLISFLLAFVMVWTVGVSALAAEKCGNESARVVSYIDETDALLIAARALNSDDPTEDVLPLGTTVNDVIRLYNENQNLIAYYVSFMPTGYAVVNSARANPSVIEFGEGANQLIENILNGETGTYIIYNNPTEIYTTDAKTKNRNSGKDVYTYFPSLKEKNPLAIAELAQLRESMESEISMCSDGDYGFIDWGDMPSGTYSYDIINKAASTDWATTGEFDSIAKNHCGATAVTNLALYYANRGYSDLKINSSVYDTFVAVHKIVGNGPVMTIAGQTKEYFSDRGYTLKYSSANTFSEIKMAIKSDHPCGILLANGIVDWHWIICVGYRAYDSGNNYMRIVDGWHDTTLKFYLCNSGSAWVSATQYWVS